jgi:O-antigen ligase
MLIVSVLAWATLALARRDPALLTAMLAVTFRWFVRIALGLVAVGVVLGPIYVPAGGENLERFTWIGAHPNGAALIITTAILLTLTAPMADLRLRSGSRAIVVAVLIAALFSNHSRTAWLEFLVAGLLVFFFAGRLRPLLHWVGVPVIAFVGVLVSVFWWDSVWSYILREGDSEDLATGHGRLELWGVGFRALDTPFDWLCGKGYGVSRTLFLPVGAWAKSAHNSVLSWLVSGGLIAVVLVLAIVVITIRGLWRNHVVATRPDGLAIVAFFTVLALNGLASDAVSEPQLAFVGVILSYAVATAIDERRGDAPAPSLPARAVRAAS